MISFFVVFFCSKSRCRACLLVISLLSSTTTPHDADDDDDDDDHGLLSELTFFLSFPRACCLVLTTVSWAFILLVDTSLVRKISGDEPVALPLLFSFSISLYLWFFFPSFFYTFLRKLVHPY